MRQDNSTVRSEPIVVRIGAKGLAEGNNDSLFQTSLDNNRYSEVVTCNDSQVITAQSINTINGQVMAQSKQFSFTPQTTTYLQVNLLANGVPVVQQVAPNRAMFMLEQNTRQTHQVSQVFIECNASKSKPVVMQPTTIVPTKPLA